MSKWVSVSDRLPAKDDDVLLRCSSKDNEFISMVVGRRAPEMHHLVYGECPWSIKLFCHDNVYLCMEKDRIYNPNDRTNFFFGEVTHWMPLPKLPDPKDE